MSEENKIKHNNAIIESLSDFFDDATTEEKTTDINELLEKASNVVEDFNKSQKIKEEEKNILVDKDVIKDSPDDILDILKTAKEVIEEYDEIAVVFDDTSIVLKEPELTKETIEDNIEPEKEETPVTQNEETETAVPVEEIKEVPGPEITIHKETVKEKSKIDISGIVVYLVLVTLLLSVFGGIIYLNKGKNEILDDISDVVDVDLPSMDETLRTKWLENKEINDDYLGELKFEKYLLKESIVQASKDKNYTVYNSDGEVNSNYSGNDIYAWTNWKTGERANETNGIGGSSYLDYDLDINDDLLVIWGRCWSREYLEENHVDETPNFTNADILLKRSNYSENACFDLILDNEIRYYTIVAVCKGNLSNSIDAKMLKSNKLSLSNINHIKANALYDTGESFDENDRYLIICTRDENDSDDVVMIVAKQTNIEYFQ